MQDSEGSLGENGIKAAAAKGIVVIAPVVLTLFFASWLLGMVDHLPGTEILELTPYTYLNQAIKLASLTITGGLIVTGVGKFVKTGQGSWAEKALDRIATSIPVVRTVYRTTKVTADTVMGGSGEFGQPVKVDLKGMNLTGFKTGNRTGEGKSLVFLPTSPNVTSGFVVEIREDMLQKTEETRAEAITKVLSAGFGTRLEKGSVTDSRKQVNDIQTS